VKAKEKYVLKDKLSEEIIKIARKMKISDMPPVHLLATSHTLPELRKALKDLQKSEKYL
jgi:hypothetical protein